MLLIAGAGRSGTSTLAGLLSRIGLHVPQPEVEPDESNPKGFAEPRWVVDFHDRMLERARVQVSDSRPQAWEHTGRICADPQVRARVSAWLGPHFSDGDAVRPELVVKDPRLGWFLPLWRHAAERCEAVPVFATMLRPIAEVVGSKQKYYANTLGSAHLTASWLNMLLHTELLTRDAPRAFVRYADLLADHRAALSAVGAQLDLAAIRDATPADWARLDDFIDPSLRRVGLDWADLALPPRLEELARTAWDELGKLASTDDPGIRATLDEVRSAYGVLYAESEAISKSSVVAARAAMRQTHQTQQARIRQPPAAPARRRDPADVIPHRLRASVPAPLRRALRRVVRRR